MDTIQQIRGLQLTVAIAILMAAGSIRARVVTIPPQEEPPTMVAGIAPGTIDPEPYAEPGEDPDCVSVEVIRTRASVRRGPSGKSRRKGVVVKGSRLPAFARARGPGCRDYWYRIHQESWICGSHVAPSDAPAWGEYFPVVEDGNLTPWPYAFVHKPAIEYKPVGGFMEELREVFKGYGFGVSRVVHKDDGAYFRTVEGRLIPKYAAGISGRLSDFEGIALEGGKPWPVGWVNSRKAWALDEPSRKKKHRIEKVERYSPFEVLEDVGEGAKRYVKFDEGYWLRGKDVRVVRDAERPASVGPDEKWIDVDISSQIITAYLGDTPVYVTMVSTGRGGGSRTIKGEFRIWVKVSAIAMDNTDEELEEDPDAVDAGLTEEERHLFSLQDVPWTQFFHENYALHGVYWHNRFGNRRSHGCVNLAPSDARWFYNWTRPHLPPGWWAIHSSPGDKGTLVRVR